MWDYLFARCSTPFSSLILSCTSEPNLTHYVMGEGNVRPVWHWSDIKMIIGEIIMLIADIHGNTEEIAIVQFKSQEKDIKHWWTLGLYLYNICLLLFLFKLIKWDLISTQESGKYWLLILCPLCSMQMIY